MSSTVWLRIEGLAVLLTSTLIYTHNGHSWLLFIILLFAPDISIVGYLQNNRTGAILYNLFHTYSLPLLLGIAAFILGAPLLSALALIWSAHIGLDRSLGYGLKLPGGFKETHLGPILP